MWKTLGRLCVWGGCVEQPFRSTDGGGTAVDGASFGGP